MPVLVFAGRKGGCGKSTGAVNTAAWLANKYPGEVALLDTDPSSESAKTFGDLRTNDALPPIHTEFVSGEIRHSIIGLANQFLWVVVDTPGLDSVETKRAMSLANAVIFPAKNSLVDQKTLPKADALLEEFQAVRPDLQGWLYLSECPPGLSGVKRRAKSMLRLEKLKCIKVLNGFTTSRNAYIDSYDYGAGVTETDDRKAAEEFNALAQEIHDHVAA